MVSGTNTLLLLIPLVNWKKQICLSHCIFSKNVIENEHLKVVFNNKGQIEKNS